jgi:hypothetical protein
MPTSISEQRDIIRRAIGNNADESKMKKELRELSARALKYDFGEAPEIPDNISEKILAAAQWTALMRSTITRDRFTKEVTHKPFSELGTRLAKQLHKLGYGIGQFRRIERIGDPEYKILRDVAISTAPSRMETIVRKVFETDPGRAYGTDELSDLLGLPTLTAQRLAENLVLISIFAKEKTGFKFVYRLSDPARQLIETAELYVK